MTPTTICRTYRRASFFRRRKFLRFLTIKLTFITFACKTQYLVVDGSRRVFTGEKVNWPAAYSWITLDSRYMAKISAAAYLRMRLISEYILYGILQLLLSEAVVLVPFQHTAESSCPSVFMLCWLRKHCKASTEDSWFLTELGVHVCIVRWHVARPSL